MDNIEWKHNSKGLCCLPAFLDNLKTLTECLASPDPGAEWLAWSQTPDHKAGAGQTDLKEKNERLGR